jgi:pilus assembly protein CpaE
MIRASAVNVVSMTRSSELGDRIRLMLDAIDDVRAETRICDLQSVNGEFVAALERVDVLLVEIDANDERELRQLGQIIEQRRGRTAILATAKDISAQGVRSLIRQGVDDFIPQPFEPADILDAIATARAKLQRARVHDKSGSVISVTRAKGGMGASTLAAHIALALCEKRHRRDPEKRVALLDLDLQFGDLSLMLDLQPNAEMVEIIRDPKRLDGALLRASMTQHKSGLFVLPAPGEFVPLDSLPVAAVAKLIELAKEEFDVVVVDLPLAVPRWLEVVLQHSDQLLAVSELNVAAIRQTRRLIDFLREEGHYDLPVSVVLNRYVWRFSERGRLKQAIRALGQPIDHYVPGDGALALEAINRGTPLFELRRGAKLCRSLRQVAAASLKSMQQREQAAGAAVQAA